MPSFRPVGPGEELVPGNKKRVIRGGHEMPTRLPLYEASQTGLLGTNHHRLFLISFDHFCPEPFLQNLVHVVTTLALNLFHKLCLGSCFTLLDFSLPKMFCSPVISVTRASNSCNVALQKWATFGFVFGASATCFFSSSAEIMSSKNKQRVD